MPMHRQQKPQKQLLPQLAQVNVTLPVEFKVAIMFRAEELKISQAQYIAKLIADDNPADR